jgi:deoxycytidylate deaminase
MGGGYNGVVAGEVHCTDGGCPRGRIAANVREHANGSSDAVERKLNRLLPAADYSDCEGIHAEWNAMLDAGRSGCERSTMYVNAVPCALCKKLAKGAGIAAIVWYDDFGTGGEDFVQLSKDIDAVESVQLRRLKRRWDEQGQKMNDINTGDLL